MVTLYSSLHHILSLHPLLVCSYLWHALLPFSGMPSYLSSLLSFFQASLELKLFLDGFWEVPLTKSHPNSPEPKQARLLVWA